MTTPAADARLWYAQRLSAMVLALCVVAHLATIVYASRGGLTAADILGRTRGSVAFAGFYALFVVACAVHVPIGLRAIALEWLGWREPVTNATAIGIAVVIAFLGLRAVVAVFAG